MLKVRWTAELASHGRSTWMGVYMQKAADSDLIKGRKRQPACWIYHSFFLATFLFYQLCVWDNNSIRNSNIPALLQNHMGPFTMWPTLPCGKIHFIKLSSGWWFPDFNGTKTPLFTTGYTISCCMTLIQLCQLSGLAWVVFVTIWRDDPIN